MNDALDEVKEKRWSVCAAARKYKIPRETLRRHVSWLAIQFPVGRLSVLSANEEPEIVETCQIFGEWGFGLTKGDITYVVADYFGQSKVGMVFQGMLSGHTSWGVIWS